MPKYTLIIILLIAACLRLFNLDHGLPAIYEEATPMRQAIEMWQGPTGGFDFNPHFFHYPALYFYLQFITQAIYFVINLIAGRIISIENFLQLYHADPTAWVLLARFINVGFGLGSIWATCRLGTLYHNQQTGLLAAALLSLMPLPVHTSRIILVDTPLLFWGTLSLTHSLHLLKNNTNSRNMWAGLSIGLATATKYTGALFAIPFAIAHLLKAKSLQKVWHQKHLILIAFITTLSTFCITNPYILLDFSSFWTDFSFERTHMSQGHFGIDPNHTAWTYLNDLGNNLGILLILCFLWGCFQISKTYRQHHLPLIIFGALYLALISTWAMGAAHYLLPIFPILTIITAMGIQDLCERIKQPTRIQIPIMAVLILSASIPTVQNLAQNSKPDTREKKKIWIEQNVPSGALIVFEHYTPDLSQNNYHLLRLPMDTIQPEIVAPFYDIHWYTDFDYIITSGGVAERYQKDPEKFNPQIQFYSDLQNHWQTIATFSGDKFSGPDIHIYKQPLSHRQQTLFDNEQYSTLNEVHSKVAEDLLQRLAQIFSEKEWYDKAIDTYRQLLNITQNQAPVLAQLGVLFYQTGQMDNAQKAWEQSIQLDSKNVLILTNLGALYLQKGDPQKAIHHWQQGLQLSPDDHDLINNLVFVYRQLGQNDPAIQILQNALKHHPQNPAYRATLKNLQKQ